MVGPATAVIELPQFTQNATPGWFVNPHFGQTTDADKPSPSSRGTRGSRKRLSPEERVFNLGER